MNPRGHRGIAAVLMLLVLVLSAMALLPARAQAATNQVTGLVSQCGSSTAFVGGATVTLNDADGVFPALTTTTASDGTFSFTPPSGNYTIAATASGYYSGGVTTPFRFDGTTTITQDFCMTQQLPSGKSSFVVTFHVQDAGTSAYIGGATVSVYNNTRLLAGQPALIATGVTNGTAGPNQGNVAMGLWADNDFNVRVNATGYGLFIEVKTIAASGTITVPMLGGVTLVGHARNAQGQFVSAGLTATLYRLDVASSNTSKLIQAAVSGSLYTFYAATGGNYRMIVDANGYLAFTTTLTLPGTAGTVSQDATLAASPQEKYLTTILYPPTDWNHITIYRNWTLLPDSSVPGLLPAGLRDLRQQINYTFGNGAGNGVVSANDITLFTSWLRGNGPVYVTTDSSLTLNGYSYNSTAFQVIAVSGLSTPGADVTIQTMATYSVKSSSTIASGLSQYALNLNVLADTNTTVYHNETYIVQLPRGYEMVTDTILPSGTINTYNFTRITVDPLIGATGIRMTLQKSTTGIARAQVVGPSGKYYVINSTYLNYQAFVANDTAITFSAAQTSNPPSNDSSRDNFTWRFLSNGTFPTPANNVRWGIQPNYTFPQAGPWNVNLTAIGSGGNVSHRNITVYVDGSLPVAAFKTNVTGPGSAAGLTLRINESTTVKFDGSLSTDQAYPGKAGVIPNSGYAWDFNGDGITDSTGQVVSWAFNKPGTFTVNLTVTDAVGWKGANATMTVQVNDTQAPVPGFTILDPNNDYAPTASLTEGHNYTFNASKTTDNYDKLSALQFTWIVHGPIYGHTGTNNTFTGLNVTWGWTTWNLSYQVTLKVNDTGYGSNKPNTGTLNANESVQIDWKLHPDLYINVGTVKIDNTQPESGATVTITMNVTNKPNRGTASQVYVSVSEGSGGQNTALLSKAAVGSGWSMADSAGNSKTAIPSGATYTLKISVAVVGQGNKTLTIRVEDGNEPYTAITSENIATLAINVLQPGWVNIAIIGAVIAVFAVVIGAMYYRRKVKAGDWQPRFRRSKEGKEEGGREKPRKEKEVKEEKKRL